MTDQEKERINELLESSNEEDNKLAFSILVSLGKSPKRYFEELMIETHGSGLRGEYKYINFSRYSSTRNNKVSYTIEFRNHWKAYIKSLK